MIHIFNTLNLPSANKNPDLDGFLLKKINKKIKNHIYITQKYVKVHCVVSDYCHTDVGQHVTISLKILKITIPC